MSKSRGNVIDPWSIIETRGADALRWYLFSAGSPWTHPARLRRGHRRGHPPVPAHALEHLLVLRHLREPRRLGARRASHDAATHVMDRWVRSRLAAHRRRGHRRRSRSFDALRGRAGARGASSTTSRTGTCAAPGRGSGRRPIPSRTRPCTSASSTRRAAARAVLPVRRRRDVPEPRRTATSRCTSPTGPTSTSVRATTPLESRWSVARELVSLGRAARVDARIETRQPLPRALVLLPTGRALDDAVVAEIADELNVKRSSRSRRSKGCSTTRSSRTSASLGPRVGERMPDGEGALADGRRRRGAARARARRRVRRSRSTAARSSSDPTTSRCAPSSTRSSRSPGTARSRSRSTSASTTSSGARAPPGSSCAALNDHRKAIGLEIADRIRVELAGDGRGARRDPCEHRDWIAGEVLAATSPSPSSARPRRVSAATTRSRSTAVGYDGARGRRRAVGVRIEQRRLGPARPGAVRSSGGA